MGILDWKDESIAPETPVACDDCDWEGTATDVNIAPDLEQRIDAGGEVPVGECPACGALAYLKTNPRYAPLFEAVERVLQSFDAGDDTGTGNERQAYIAKMEALRDAHRRVAGQALPVEGEP